MRAKIAARGLALALSMTASSVAFADLAEIEKRCAEDSLDQLQAIERVEWYQKNYPAEILAHVQNELGDSTVTLEQAIAYYRNIMLTDPISGGPARRPKYPTFTTEDYRNPEQYFAAGYGYVPGSTAGDRNSPAARPSSYVWSATCVSYPRFLWRPPIPRCPPEVFPPPVGVHPHLPPVPRIPLLPEG